jgi:hypothetical protein
MHLHTTPGSEGSLRARFNRARSEGLNGGFTAGFRSLDLKYKTDRYVNPGRESPACVRLPWMSRDTGSVLGSSASEVRSHRLTSASAPSSSTPPLPSSPSAPARHSPRSGAYTHPLFQLNVSTVCPMWWGALLVSVTKTAQVEQRCGRVKPPARGTRWRRPA